MFVFERSIDVFLAKTNWLQTKMQFEGKYKRKLHYNDILDFHLTSWTRLWMLAEFANAIKTQHLPNDVLSRFAEIYKKYTFKTI